MYVLQFQVHEVYVWRVSVSIRAHLGDLWQLGAEVQVGRGVPVHARRLQAEEDRRRAHTALYRSESLGGGMHVCMCACIFLCMYVGMYKL